MCKRVRKIYLISSYSSLLYELNEEDMVVKKDKQGNVIEILGTIEEVLLKFEETISPYGIMKAHIMEKVDNKWNIIKILSTPKMKADEDFKIYRLDLELVKCTNRVDEIVSEIGELVIMGSV